MSDQVRAPRHRVGIDIGGTFTDFALLDEAGGRVQFHKCLTTADDPSRAVSDGLEDLLRSSDVRFGDVDLVVHGTTLVTNLLIERKGARVGLLTTAGFRDTLEIRNEQRYDIYDLRLKFPLPLVPRESRLELVERTDRDGRVLIELDETNVAARIEELRQQGIESIAVVLLHSFANSRNERRVADLIARLWPEVPVSLSSEIAPIIREYERSSTTVANAYVQPLVQTYLGSMRDRLHGRGFRGQLSLMLSSGGTCSAETATRQPIRLVESGPAAGALAAAFYGELTGEKEFVAFDMGGTTAKLSLITSGEPTKSSSIEVARLARFRPGSGIPLQVPTVDLIEIGAGGGSIAHLDSIGLLKVGPESAGAEPGPACYGRGGDRPTVTDADLFLGYLDPSYFLGGRMLLEAARAHAALGELAAQSRLPVETVALGIQKVVDEAMASAARIHLVERGRDPRALSLFAFGGAGPVHARAVARHLGIHRVVCPLGAGVTSALGLAVAPLSVELAQSAPVRSDGADWATIEAVLLKMERQAREILLADGVAESEITLTRSAEGRYTGQLHEVSFEVPRHLDVSSDQALTAFAEVYSRRFGHTHRDRTVEILTWRLSASGRRRSFLMRMPVSSASRTPARRRCRRMNCDGVWVDAVVLDRYSLGPGAKVVGPAAIEERESTVILGADDQAHIDEYLNLVIDLA